MAGIIDYKGRIIRKRNKQRAGTPQIVMAVQCKELAILRRLSEMTGSTLEMMAPQPLSEIMRTGCKEHCPDKHIHVQGNLFMPGRARWTKSGSALHTILVNVMPYLCVDRGYPELINEILASAPLSGQGSGAVIASCAKLWRLGWEIPEPYWSVLEQRLAAVFTEPEILELEGGFSRHGL